MNVGKGFLLLGLILCSVLPIGGIARDFSVPIDLLLGSRFGTVCERAMGGAQGSVRPELIDRYGKLLLAAENIVGALNDPSSVVSQTQMSRLYGTDSRFRLVSELASVATEIRGYIDEVLIWEELDEPEARHEIDRLEDEILAALNRVRRRVVRAIFEERKRRQFANEVIMEITPVTSGRLVVEMYRDSIATFVANHPNLSMSVLAVERTAVRVTKIVISIRSSGGMSAERLFRHEAGVLKVIALRSGARYTNGAAVTVLPVLASRPHPTVEKNPEEFEISTEGSVTILHKETGLRVTVDQSNGRAVSMSHANDYINALLGEHYEAQRLSREGEIRLEQRRGAELAAAHRVYELSAGPPEVRDNRFDPKETYPASSVLGGEMQGLLDAGEDAWLIQVIPGFIETCREAYLPSQLSLEISPR